MKTFQRTFAALLFGASLFLLAPAMAQDAKAPALALRNASAVKALKQDNTIAVYAKGLCCSSCGIGVRKHLSKLGFIDQERFNKGIDLDIKSQLAIIAIKADQVTDKDELSKAIVKAGYDPVELYQTRGDKVTKTFIK